jgi:hypothetical protein
MPYLRLGNFANSLLRTRAISIDESLYIVSQGKVDSFSLEDKAFFKIPIHFDGHSRMFFDWMNYWTPLIPFHSQMLAQDQLIDEQGYRNNSNSTNPEGRMGVRDDENSR